VGTLASGADPVLKRKKIDLLVMDEATQATEPGAWIPVLRAEKIIMAGDHFQLPPTVISKKAEDMGLAKTLFERLHTLVGEEWKTLLRIQYRMHEKIMAFSSKQFYEGKLIAHESDKNHTLADLPHVQENPETKEIPILILTAKEGQEERIRGLELGADDYISMPFHLASLARKIDYMLSKKEKG
jgi:superfamily I DNA and/or RNA helicase